MSATSVFVVLKTESPAVGIATNTAGSDSSSSSKTSSSSHAGPIAGGIVAAVILLALIGGFAWFMRKRSRRDRDTRALDDFFKDNLTHDGNGGGAVAGATAGGTASTRKSMRRKSSMIVDLEKERNLSHSNDEDNWAAMTRISSLADEDNGEVYRRLSQSRQSLNAISRAVSMHSMIAPEAALVGATGWDGISEKQMVEEPHSMLNRVGSDKSSLSPYSPSNMSPLTPYDGNRLQRVRHLSSRSTDLLPSLSPGLYSLHSSPESPNALLTPGEEPIHSSAPNTLGRQQGSYHRLNHHMSISSVYAPTQPSAVPKQRSFSSSSQQMPERPKSALGIMAVSGQNYHPSQRPQQWSPPSSPQNHPVNIGNRNQARASVHGYSQYGPYTNWSPPLVPQRIISPRRPRPSSVQPQLSGEYPPSRYSHLDIVKQATDSEAEGEVQAVAAFEGARQRSLSGGILLKSPMAISETNRVNGNAIGVDASPSSSTSTSKKNSLSIRNASPEMSTEEDEELKDPGTANPASTQAYHQKMAKNVSEKAQALMKTNGEAGQADEAHKKSNLWYPQAWLTAKSPS